MSKERAKKLVKIYFNGCTFEKALKLDWVSQAFPWDKSEPVADTNEGIRPQPLAKFDLVKSYRT